MSNTKKMSISDIFGKLFRNQIFVPIAAMLILLIFNLIADPSFFRITLGYNSAGNPVLSGYLMTAVTGRILMRLWGVTASRS